MLPTRSANGAATKKKMIANFPGLERNCVIFALSSDGLAASLRTLAASLRTLVTTPWRSSATNQTKKAGRMSAPKTSKRTLAGRACQQAGMIIAAHKTRSTATSAMAHRASFFSLASQIIKRDGLGGSGRSGAGEWEDGLGFIPMFLRT